MGGALTALQIPCVGGGVGWGGAHFGVLLCVLEILLPSPKLCVGGVRAPFSVSQIVSHLHYTPHITGGWQYLIESEAMAKDVSD